MRKCLLGAFVVAIGSTVAFAMGILNLPPGLVTVTHGPWPNGATSTLDITLSDVPPGYDVMNGIYAGWCIEDNHQPDLGAGEGALLLDSTDVDPLMCGPWNYPGVPWDKINYLLNHQIGTKYEIQAAMWIVAGTDDPFNPTFPDDTPNVLAMVADTNLNGPGFLPWPGDVTAVIICADGIDPGYPYYQDTIIEVPLGAGCTPGYWKQEHHYDSWPVDPSTLFGPLFGVTPSIEDLTLAEALNLRGGGEKALLRHAAAAYLNALSLNGDYFFTLAEVIAFVQDAYATGDFEGAKDQLATENERGCPFD